MDIFKQLYSIYPFETFINLSDTVKLISLVYLLALLFRRKKTVLLYYKKPYYPLTNIAVCTGLFQLFLTCTSALCHNPKTEQIKNENEHTLVGRLSQKLCSIFSTILFRMSNLLDIDFVIKLNDRRSRRFDLNEVIFKCE